jgi:hypothetical protein
MAMPMQERAIDAREAGRAARGDAASVSASALLRRGLVLWCLLAAGCGGGGSPTSSSGAGGDTGSGRALREVRVSRAGCTEPCQPLYVGDQAQMKAEAVYADSSTSDVTSRSTWSSNNPSAVAVDSKGLVTAAGPALADIAAEFDGAKGSYHFDVSPQSVAASITLQRFECIADCEDFTQGAGDFSYSATILAGTIRAKEFKQDAVVRVGQGESRNINAKLDVSVPDASGWELGIEFCATEWDLGDAPDPRMNGLCRTARYRQSTGRWIPEGANYITLGSGSCVVRLHYLISDVRYSKPR